MANIEKYHPAAGYSANYAKKKVAEYMKQEEKEDTRKRIRRAPDPLTVNEEDMIVEELIVDETGQLIEVPIKTITTPPKYVIGLRRWAAACRVPRQHMNLLLRVLNTSHGGYPSDYKELMGDSAAVAWEEEELPVEANGTTGSASDPSILRVITDLSAKITQLLEEQENLKHQIRRLSAEQKVRDEAVTSSVKNIKVNVRDMKAYLVKPLDLDIIWPIEDTEVFREVEKKIRINTIYADSVSRFFTELPNCQRKLKNFFSGRILDGFSEAGRGERVKIKDSPFLKLIAHSWCDGLSIMESIATMNKELVDLKNSMSSAAARAKSSKKTSK